MKLFYEDEAEIIQDVRARGLAAVLGADAELTFCDRSLANEGPPDLPAGTPVPEGFDEISFEVPEAEVSPHEVFITDAPAGRYFSLSAAKVSSLALRS